MYFTIQLTDSYKNKKFKNDKEWLVESFNDFSNFSQIVRRQTLYNHVDYSYKNEKQNAYKINMLT